MPEVRSVLTLHASIIQRHVEASTIASQSQKSCSTELVLNVNQLGKVRRALPHFALMNRIHLRVFRAVEFRRELGQV